MELEDLKQAWTGIDNNANQLPKLNPLTINKMIRTKYYSSLNRIVYSEIAGVAVCLIAAVFIGLNFNQLDSLYLRSAGVCTILLLLILSTISLMSLRQFNLGKDINQTYADVLGKFAEQKLRFFKFQRINMMLCYMQVVTTIVLISKFLNGRDVVFSTNYWIFSFVIGYLFLLFYSKWVSKYYGETIRKTEELLDELKR